MADRVTRPSRRGKTKLANGRSLGWAEWGDERGRPVLLCPGAGTSASLGFGAELLDRLEVRLIGIDRPGIGLSEPDPGRTLLDWADDVGALIEARDLGACPVVGFSQGAPFALACAAKRVVSGVAIVSGSDELAAPQLRERLSEGTRDLVERVADEPAATEAWLAQMSPAKLHALITDAGVEDRAVYLQPSFCALLRRALDEGFCQGPRGYARDTMLALGRWNFELGAIEVPVHLWYGALDHSPVHSPDHGAILATRIPGARRTVVDQAGGALLWTHAGEILRGLLY
jgi:pimeloyl-ACP methyl ester carboxylesterase